MKNRILSVLLAFAMIFALMPTALAAPTTYQVVTVDKTTVQAGETVNVKVTLPNISETAGSFTVNLKFDTTLFEVVSVDVPTTLNATTKSGKATVVPVVYGEADDANNSGELTANAAYTYNTIQVAGVTVIDATLKAKATGTAAFSFTTFEITKSEGSTVWIVKDTDLEAPPSVTIPKSPITTVTASVDAPVKGQPLDTTVDIGTATGYTGTVEWYEGTTATGSPVTGKAKPGQFYYARITLTANSGETFDEKFKTGTISGAYSVTRVSDTELLLTHSFPKTDTVKVTEVRIGGTPPTLNVPEATDFGVPSTVTVPKTYSVDVHTDGGILTNPSGVKWSVSGLEGVTVDPDTGNLTISSNCPGGQINLTATYGGESDTATPTVFRATPAVKWLKIVDKNTGGAPQTTIIRPVGDDPADMIDVKYEAKGYDQFSQPATITTVDWKLNPIPKHMGTLETVGGPYILTLHVFHNTETIPFDLTATLKANPTIKDTVTIKAEDKPLKTLEVTQADTTYGTALADPVFTAPEGTIKTLVHYSTPTSSAYSSDTPPPTRASMW